MRLIFRRKLKTVPPAEIWIDVGAHLGEKTFPLAQANPAVRVYAFEPNLRPAMQLVGLLPNFIVVPIGVGERNGTAKFYVNAYEAASSLLPLNPEAASKWIGGHQLQVVEELFVPVIRLDTFMELAGIEKVDYLKIDAQGADLAVVRSAGRRLKDIRKISLEVQITSFPLYVGAQQKDEVVKYMQQSGFELVSSEKQTYDQEENLTFCRI